MVHFIATKALKDAGIPYSAVEQAVVGYVFGEYDGCTCPHHTLSCYLGDSTCGQRAVYELGLTGIPVYNVSFHTEVSIKPKSTSPLHLWSLSDTALVAL